MQELRAFGPPPIPRLPTCRTFFWDAAGLAPPTLEIDLSHAGEDRRAIVVRAADPAWADRLADLT